MAGSLVDRALRMLELLAVSGGGLKLTQAAERLGIPKSAVHRLLADLMDHGYVRMIGPGHYVLTAKLLGLGHAWMSSSGLVNLVQPALDELAAATGELVRYAVVEDERLTWVAKAQGARFGLRVDPDQGIEALLHCTATGHAWLSSLDDENALRLVLQQGFGRLTDAGPNAPRTIDALRNRLRLARERGYAWVSESSAIGTASLAAPVRFVGQDRVAAVLTISGPSARLTEPRMHELAPQLLQAAGEVGALELSRPDTAPPIGRGSVPALTSRRA